MSIYDTLNERQKEAVLQTEGPVLILAGAGSGKTRVLTHRIAWLIDRCGVDPWNIMAITFTNKAAGEMRARVDQIVGFGSEKIWVSTFHSSCVRILRRYIDRLGYDTNFTIYDTDDQKTVMKDVCKRLQIDVKMLKERTILNAISSAKNECMTPEEFARAEDGDFTGKRIAEAYAEYQRTLRRNNALDFDDLLLKTVELFKTCPEVLDSYQERLRYIMVDEYQDTNTVQFELIRLLAAKYRNLCVVGDDDQSIYKFRGANIRNILDFEKVYPEAKVVRLEQNYRSTQNVLDAANEIIRNNVGRKEKRLWTDKGAGSLIHFRQFDTAYDEAEFIAQDIGQKERRGALEYGDCAVLFRTNAQARLLEERFVTEGIPYDVVGGVNFYARKEIRDLLSYLKTVDNGSDDVAVRRIINIPRRGIGATTIARVQEYANERQISFYDALREADQIASLGRSAAKLGSFVMLIQSLRAKVEHYGIAGLLRDIIETTGYVRELEDSDEDDAESRIENIDELMNKVVSYEESHEEASLSGFLQEVALVADIDNVSQEGGRVLLMTLHSAKGLEFSDVYLSGMEDGLFPGYLTITSDDPAEMEEERRLAYVGITRAKKELTLTCARARMVRGETQYNMVSRFLREIPESLLDHKLPDRKVWEWESGETLSFGSSYGDGVFVTGGRRREGSASMSDSWGHEGGAAVAGGRKPSSDGFYTASAPEDGIGQTRPSVDTRPRPKAVWAPRRTAEENKPFLTKASAGLSGLSKGAPAGGRPDYEEGDRVRHIKYGEGTVTKIEEGARDYQVTVDFDSAGTKIMYAAFAKLRRV